MIYGFDIETRRKNGYLPGAIILTAALAGPRKVEAWGLGHPDVEERYAHDQDGELGDRTDVLLLPERLLKVLEDPRATIVGHNLFFDVAFIEARIGGGWRVQAQLFDTMIAHTLVDENHDNALEDVALKYLGVGKIQGLDRRFLDTYPLKKVLAYNMRDARLSRRLHKPLLAELRREDLLDVFARRTRTLRILIDMHHAGFGVDWRRLKHESGMVGQELERLEASLRRRVGRPRLNLRSRQQVAEILYGDFKLPVLVRTKKAQEPAVSKPAIAALRFVAKGKARNWLEDLATAHTLGKLKSGFLDALPEHRGVDDRIHTAFHVGRGGGESRDEDDSRHNEYGTVTHRLSSSEPNLQNIERGARLRECFIPTKGWRLAEADYSQIEPAVAAWLSADLELRGIFERGEDYHTGVLALLEGRPYQDVLRLVEKSADWKEKRQIGKRVNLGILYGAYPKKIHETARDAGMALSFDAIKRTWHTWRDRFVGYGLWEENVKHLVRADGVLVNPWGARRRLVLPEWADHFERLRLERQGVNFLIQSSAAEIIFTALDLLHAKLQTPRLCQELRLVLTIHDSIVFDYQPRRWRSLEGAVRAIMVNEVRAALGRRGLPDLEHLHLKVDVAHGLKSWRKG